MAWTAVVATTTRLAAIIGVSHPAIARAEQRRKLARGVDGRWHCSPSSRSGAQPRARACSGRGRSVGRGLSPPCPCGARCGTSLSGGHGRGGAEVSWDNDEDEDWGDEEGDE